MGKTANRTFRSLQSVIAAMLVMSLLLSGCSGLGKKQPSTGSSPDSGTTAPQTGTPSASSENSPTGSTSTATTPAGSTSTTDTPTENTSTGSTTDPFAAISQPARAPRKVYAAGAWSTDVPYINPFGAEGSYTKIELNPNTWQQINYIGPDNRETNRLLWPDLDHEGALDQQDRGCL
jgi:hypothetical protein